jgi:hypothetical protein
MLTVDTFGCGERQKSQNRKIMELYPRCLGFWKLLLLITYYLISFKTFGTFLYVCSSRGRGVYYLLLSFDTTVLVFFI